MAFYNLNSPALSYYCFYCGCCLCFIASGCCCFVVSVYVWVCADERVCVCVAGVPAIFFLFNAFVCCKLQIALLCCLFLIHLLAFVVVVVFVIWFVN